MSVVVTMECGTLEDGARPLCYQSKPRDPKTCLGDFGARDYATATGRRQTVDPVLPIDRALRDPQQWNRYAYARNNPLTYTDPDGRFIVPLVVAAVSASYVDSEAASTAYDVYDAAKTLTDRNASTGATAMAVGAVIHGTMTVGPGSVWAKGGKEVSEHASDGMKAANSAEARGKLTGPTTDKAGNQIGRIVVNPKGNAMLDPVGGKTVPAGPESRDTHTLYPNGSNDQRLNPQVHGNNPTPCGHSHAPGSGPGMKGQGPSLDVNGNVVPWSSPAAHWPIK
jgi:RHS repeat-associated protein